MIANVLNDYLYIVRCDFEDAILGMCEENVGGDRNVRFSDSYL